LLVSHQTMVSAAVVGIAAGHTLGTSTMATVTWPSARHSQTARVRIPPSHQAKVPAVE